MIKRPQACYWQYIVGSEQLLTQSLHRKGAWQAKSFTLAEVQHLLHAHVAVGGRLAQRAQLGQAVDRRTCVVQRVVAAQLLAKAVLDARQLQDLAHGTASNDTCAPTQAPG